MKCLVSRKQQTQLIFLLNIPPQIILTIACSVLGDAEPSADPQYPYGAGLLGHQYGHGLLPRHHGAGLLGHQYGYGGPYSSQPQAIPASVVEAPASAPAPYDGYGGYGLPYGYAQAGIHGYPGYAPRTGYAPQTGFADHTGYAHPGAYRGYTGWPYVATAAALAAAQKKD